MPSTAETETDTHHEGALREGERRFVALMCLLGLSPVEVPAPGATAKAVIEHVEEVVDFLIWAIERPGALGRPLTAEELVADSSALAALAAAVGRRMPTGS